MADPTQITAPAPGTASPAALPEVSTDGATDGIVAAATGSPAMANGVAESASPGDGHTAASSPATGAEGAGQGDDDDDDDRPSPPHDPHPSSSEPEPPSAAAQAEVEVESLRAQVADLTAQVTGLNAKLVRSFERVSDLEDDVSDSTAQLHASRTRIAALETERKEHVAALNTGLLVEKAHVSAEMQRMMERLVEETAQRGKAEADKASIEKELDDLSANLFSEANNMVAAARLEKNRAEEKSREMQERLRDTESLIREQQRTMQELKERLEAAEQDRRAMEDALLDPTDAEQPAGDGDGADAAAPPPKRRFSAQALLLRSALRAGSLPGSPGLPGSASAFSTLSGPQSRAGTGGFYLYRDVGDPYQGLMINIVPFREFVSFLAHLKKLRGQLAPFYVAVPTSSHRIGANDARPSFDSAPPSPTQHLPPNAEQLVQLSSQSSLPFIKRAVEEDTEPTLRLDVAPGLNWLTRRQVNSAILDGTLVIEPAAPGMKEEDLLRAAAALPAAACALCGTPVLNVPVANAQLSHSTTTLHPTSAPGSTTDLPSSNEPTSAGSSTLGFGTGSKMRSNLISSFSSFKLGVGGSGSGSGGGSSPSTPSFSSTINPFHGRKSSDPVGSSSHSSSAPSLLPVSSLADNNDADLSSPALSPTSPNPPPPHHPIPTHIFRITESSTNRYLLCPHHCLRRLRSVCEFWGYVRVLERGIVLEGKWAFGNRDGESGRGPWDEEQRAGAGSTSTSATAPSQPSPSDAGPSSAPPSSSTTPAAPAAPAEANGAAGNGKVDGRSSSNGSSDEGDVEEDDVKTLSASAKEEEPNVMDGSEDDEQDKDAMFASAEASPSSSSVALPNDVESTTTATATAQEPAAEGPAGALEISTSTEAGPTVTTTIATPSSESTDTATATATESDRKTPTGNVAPALPPRNPRRRPPAAPADSPLSNTPNPNPNPNPTTAPPSGTAGPGVPAKPPSGPRSSLPLPGLILSSTTSSKSATATAPGAGHKELGLSWEEKCWLEVVKLKEDMFRCRIGIRADE